MLKHARFVCPKAYLSADFSMHLVVAKPRAFEHPARARISEMRVAQRLPHVVEPGERSVLRAACYFAGPTANGVMLSIIPKLLSRLAGPLDCTGGTDGTISPAAFCFMPH